MIGMAPRVPTTITVLRYDSRRKFVADACDRQRVIEAIADHLRRNFYWERKSLQQMYAVGANV